MKPLYLYMENFTCYRKSELDLSDITSVLIVGRQDHNELESNGIGKTSIFRAIEYALFAQTRHPVIGKDIMLERLIQDDAAKLVVVFDFDMDGEVYRISRARTRKGATDLYFYRRNTVEGKAHTPTTDKALWTSLTCRRTADTDAEIAKLVRIGYKSFINTNHSMQLDVGGIATATPEKRRAILKDVLDLLPYGALEQIAKKRAEALATAIKDNRLLLTPIGDPDKDIIELRGKVVATDEEIEKQTADLSDKRIARTQLNDAHTVLVSRLGILESNAASVIQRKAIITSEISAIQSSLNTYSAKRKTVISEATLLNTELANFKVAKNGFVGIDFSVLPKLNAALIAAQERLKASEIELGTHKAELVSLNVPMPEDGTCKHCRSVLTPEHRRTCMDDIAKQKSEKASTIKSLSSFIGTLKAEQATLTTQIKQLETQQRQLDEMIAKIEANEKDRLAKKRVYEEYDALTKKFGADLLAKQAELEQANKDVEEASAKEIDALKTEVSKSKVSLSAASVAVEVSNKQLNELLARKAVLEHSITEKTKDVERKNELATKISAFEEEYATYPYVIQCFASIPDLIIENVITALQEETNTLLAQIRPELQLEFVTEKTRSDGDQEDTLLINYYLNNKPKDYSQLSGAQLLCVMFAFKVGLSFLIKKMTGSQIKFLMLDEVDMPFSHAAVDAYADIIRFFSKDFTVFVITHNDRLKSKFSNAILVEQDKNGVSRAKVVSSW